ncbi:MAG: hypothetical protein WCG20_01765 [bacterium]
MHTFFMNLWSTFVRTMHSIHFFKYGFMMNDSIWIHMIGGGILGKIIHRYLPAKYTILIVLGIAITWEFIEIYLETPNKAALLAVYGSVERYIYDSIGDIIGAVIIAALCIF